MNDSMLKKRTILSLEQALTLPYATQRFAQLGWRVIRIESGGKPGQKRPGDPNRYIGESTSVDDARAYFVAPNIGKEAITINLKEEKGQSFLKEIISKLKVDVFLCNTLPKHYKQLGIDYDSLKEANPDLIWCGISALGPDHPDRAGYDPALQAMLGYMHLTGEPDRDPMLCGLPIIDLKAGDEAFAQVLLALLEKEESGKGKKIDISMAQCATSWLITALPSLEFTTDEKKLPFRSANEHRSFIPSNCYPARDGYVYLAIGSDTQWQKLCSMKGFEHLDKPGRNTNNERKTQKDAIYADIRKGLEQYSCHDFIEQCMRNGLAVAPVNNLKQVAALDCVKNAMLKTTLPDGRTVELFPAPVTTEYLEKHAYTMAFPPRLGQDNEKIKDEIKRIKDKI